MNSSLHISLPASMKEWVEEQAIKRGFGTTDAFFLDMLQKEKESAARAHIDQLLLEAINSGEPTPMDRADWDRIRATCREAAQAQHRT